MDHIVVRMIPLLLGCGLPLMSADICHESFPLCPLNCRIDDTAPPGFSQANGAPLPLLNYVCISEHTDEPCAVDVFNVTHSHTQNGTPAINLKLDITCSHPHSRITLSNPEARERRDLVTFLMVRNCDIYWKDLTLLGVSFGLKVLYLVDSRDEFANGEPDYFDCVPPEGSLPDSTTALPPMIPTTGLRNVSDDAFTAGEFQEDCPANHSLKPLYGLRSIGSLGVININAIAPLSPVFNSHLWPVLAEVQFKGILDAHNLHCLRQSMPNLQAIELLGPSGEHAETIPAFPWSQEPMALPRGLQRTNFLHDHYAITLGILLPKNLYRRVYTFDGYRLGNLSGVSLQGELLLVRMRGCDVTELDTDAFSKVTNLQVLDLESNLLRHLPSGLLGGLTSLHRLNLRNNLISSLPVSLFQTASTLEYLNLGRNKLTRIDDFVFEDLPSVKSIDLSENIIDYVSNYATGATPQSSKLLRLTSVNLNNNNLSAIPTWVFYTRYLEDILLANNTISFAGFKRTLTELSNRLIIYGNGYSISSEDNPYLPNRDKKIDLRNNPLEKMDMNLTERLKDNLELLLNFYELDVRNTAMHCDCTMLELQLYFQDMRTRDDRDYDVIGVHRGNYDDFICYEPMQVHGQRLVDVPHTTFYCPRELEDCPTDCVCYERSADHAVIVNCTGRQLTALPDQVPRLTVDLLFSNNRLKQLPSPPPHYVRSLRKLDLSNNKLDHLDHSLVPFVSDLEELLLHTNQLTNLPHQMEHLPRHVTLTLGDNHYLCDCHAKWLKNWMLERIRQITDIEKVICAGGVPQSQLLIEVHDSEFVCVVHIGTVAASVLGAIVVVILAISVPAYVYRGEIKVYLYMRFNWHPFDRTDDSDVINKDFDAFVSYSHHDAAWVFRELRPRLEDEEPSFRLCIDDRDFMAGAAIAENIASALNTSRRMILVLSKDFLNSDWCHHEFQQAHYKVTKERTNYLIVVLCGDVSSEDLDEDMKLYLRTNTYLSRDNRWFWDKLRYAMPQTPLLKVLEQKNMLVSVGQKV